MKTALTILASSILTAILLLCVQVGADRFDNYCSRRLSDARHDGYKSGRSDGLSIGRESLERLHKSDLENATKIWVLSEGSVAQRHYEYIRDLNVERLLMEVEAERNFGK